MAQTNINLLQDYFDEVINRKQLNLIPKYFSEKFVAHGTPYVGIGIMPDTTSGEKVVVQRVFRDSPAEGKLLEGDVISGVTDGNRTWNTFEELREGGLWGQGVIGTPLTLRIKRGNEDKEVTITRGFVQGQLFPYELHAPQMREFFKDWPDVKVSLVNSIEAGDQVAFEAQFQGQNIRYGRSAVWTEFGLVSFQDGKIIDWRNSGEDVSVLRQLGYSILSPEMVKV